jgi:hypothetical protein
MQRAYGLEIPQSLQEVCSPQRMALPVYDMQVGIVRHVPADRRGHHHPTAVTGLLARTHLGERAEPERRPDLVN